MMYKIVPNTSSHSFVKTILLLIPLLLITAFFFPQKAFASTYYVSPNGNDSNNGSINSPWQTLTNSLTKLSPGDTLNLREGTYYESSITTGLDGTANSPITIQSYPGEEAIIDGGVSYFKNTPNNEWQLVDGDIHLYRTNRTFSSSFVGAWLLDYNTQLYNYTDTGNSCDGPASLRSSNYTVSGTSPVYQGPGVLLQNNYVYIRLELGPYDQLNYEGDPINFPQDTNPNHHKIALFTSQTLLTLNNASYLVFKNIEFIGARKILQLTGGTHDIEIDGCAINHNINGIPVTGASNIKIHHSVFNNGFPEYGYWSDVKGGSQDCNFGYPEFQSFSLVGVMDGFDVYENIFENTMDALYLTGGQDISIRNNIFRIIRDDAINIERDVSNVEISRNLFWHIFAGISIIGDDSDSPSGNVYIHHNIIDNSYYQRDGRDGCYRWMDHPQWSTGAVFSSHGSGNKAAYWKVYQNNVVVRIGGYGHAAGPFAVTDNPEKYVFNNIFYALDSTSISLTCSHYGGNVVWQATGTSDLSSQGDWFDPGLNSTAIDNPTFEDLATMRNRYLPSNPQVFTPGVSYTGLNWPGIDGVDYRGALGPVDPTLPRCFSTDDSYIGSDDVGIWAQDYAQLGSSLDINGDDKINAFEFAYLHLNWGLECENTF